MKELQLFNYQNKEIRVIQIDGEPWWVAKDVLSILGYADAYNPSRAMDVVPDEWKGVQRIHTPGGIQSLLCLSEQGLYFFLARSDKGHALPFQKWIAGEVVPSIRRQGFYKIEGKSDFEIILMGYEKLMDKVKQLSPKAEAFDTFMDGENSISVSETAKLFNVGPYKLFRMLRDAKIFKSNNVPYQDYIHHFEVIVKPIQIKDKIENKLVTLVKPSGVEFIMRKFNLKKAS